MDCDRLGDRKKGIAISACGIYRKSASRADACRITASLALHLHFPGPMPKTGKPKLARPYVSKSPSSSLPLICLVLALALIAIYWRVLQNGFINFDDDIYVTANPHIRNGLTWEGLEWAFTSVSYVYFQPLTWLSHMLDVSWFGLNAAGHHMVSVFLHTATSLMLFLWLFEATGKRERSLCAAALFAFHPLRVESVAWAAERKDVLSTCLFLAALLAYSRYARQPSRNRYLILAATLTLGLLAKPMLVAAPLLFLLVDYWPLHRTGSLTALIKEKIPLLILAAIMAAVTYFGQKQAGAMRMLQQVTAVQHAENAVVSYVRYLGKEIWPYPLTVLYPYDSQIPLWQVTLAALLLFAITLAAFRVRKNLAYLLTGWVWYLIALAPVIGIVQVGMQAYADRFSYIPSIGLVMASVWGIADVAKRLHWPPKLLPTVTAAVLIIYAGATFIQLAYWRDSITLLQYTVDHTGPNPLAEQNLGEALAEANRNSEALPHLAAAVKAEPDMFQAQYNLGKAQALDGDTAAAIASFSQALRLKPDYAEAYYARAVMYGKAGEANKAGPDLEAALKHGLSPQYQAEAHNNLGVVAARSGDIERAAAQFLQAVQARPSYAEAQINLSTALVQSGRKQEAISRLTEALATSDNAPAVRSALARLTESPR